MTSVIDDVKTHVIDRRVTLVSVLPDERRELHRARFFRLVEDLKREWGASESEVMRRLRLSSSYAASMRRREGAYPGADAMTKIVRALRIRDAYFNSTRDDSYQAYRTPSEPSDGQGDDAATSPAGWLALAASGALRRYREAGVPETQIQQVRRINFYNGGTADDYRRLLDALLVSHLTGQTEEREEDPRSVRARESREADLEGLLEDLSVHKE